MLMTCFLNTVHLGIKDCVFWCALVIEAINFALRS